MPHSLHQGLIVSREEKRDPDLLTEEISFMMGKSVILDVGKGRGQDVCTGAQAGHSREGSVGACGVRQGTALWGPGVTAGLLPCPSQAPSAR